MDLTKTYEWEFDLEEYTMTTDVSEDYLARMKTGKTADEEEIIKDIAIERTDIRPETLRMCNQLMGDKIIQKLCEGYIVSTQTATYVPSITGVFMGATGNVDSTKNLCIVNISNSQALRKALKNVKPKFSGLVRTMGGARIALVRDVRTKKTDGTITSGQLLDVTGNKIRCLNADGSDLGVIRFLNADTRAEVATVEASKVGMNDPSRLMFAIPASLPQGTYRLRVETYFSNASTRLKSSRVIDYEQDLYVGQAPTTPSGEQTGGDDDDSGQGTFG